MTAAGTPRASPRLGAKADRLVKHCVYEIATGAWPAGHRLPSLREAEGLWSVNHLTVLKAYRRLEELGLVRSEPRSGYFVADHKPSARMKRDREELEAIYGSVTGRLRERGWVSTVGAFRYLAQLAESRARRQPACAFVECTSLQAEGHAREIRDRLELACLALTPGELQRQPLPAHVRCLLTTGFHRAEVVDAAPDAVEVITVPIEFSPRTVATLGASAGEVLFLALDADVADHIARDATQQLERFDVDVTSRSCDADGIEAVLAAVLSPPGPVRRDVVLSPSLWNAAASAWRKDERVHMLEYRIVESAWTELAGSLGVPLRSMA